MKLILASTSKFKSEILSKVKMKHSMVESDFEEVSENKDNVYQYVMDIALGKAKSVENKLSSGIIVGLDTVVWVDNKILEKPKSLEEARNNVKISMGKTTQVVTGICLINKDTNEIISDYQETKVTLKNISKEDRDYYINNEPDIMYVSGYVVETVISNFLEKIEGSYYNILGIPVEKIYEHLNNWNIYLNDLE